MSALVAWLAKINPNLIVTAVVTLATYLWHQFASPAAQKRASDAWQAALGVAEGIMKQLAAVSPPGTTEAQLKVELLAAAAVQLRAIGLDPNKLPANIEAALGALIQKVLAEATLRPVPGPKAA